MKEFYEPMLYLSTPEHPNTMCILAVLKEPIDGEILRGVVEELRTRFPYFYVKAVPRDNDIYPETNPLPMTVRNTWAPVNLNARESNDHLAAWKYEGTRMALEISHSLSDGAGVFPYVKSVLYLYLSRKTGRSLDPAGFHLPGDVIPESETGNPFAELDIDAAEQPLYTKKAAADFYRLNQGGNTNPQVHFVRLAEQQMMQYCRDFDGSPNALLAVVLARAVRQYDPASEQTVSVSIAVDHKAMLGVYDNYRLFANVIELDFPKDRPLDDLLKSCTIARGQMMLQAQPENSLWALKERKALYAKMDQVPLDMKLSAMAKASGNARWSFSVSYTNNRNLGSLNPYLEALYTVGEPGVADLCFGVTCINRSFCLAISQSFPADRFIDTFLRELSSVGIDCEVIGKEPLRLCGMEPFQR